MYSLSLIDSYMGSVNLIRKLANQLLYYLVSLYRLYLTDILANIKKKEDNLAKEASEIKMYLIYHD